MADKGEINGGDGETMREKTTTYTIRAAAIVTDKFKILT